MRIEPPKPVLPAGPRSPAEWETTIAELHAERTALQVEMEAIDAERRGLALSATSGDPAAQTRIAELNQRQIEAGHRQDLLTSAVSVAEENLGLARQAVVDARAAEQRAQQVAGATRTAQAAAAVDAAAQDLGRAMTAYLAEVDALRRAGVDSTYFNKLRNRTMMAGAMHAASLSGHLPLPAVSAHHRSTMEAWARRMLAHLLDPPPGEAEAEGEAA